VEEARIKQTGEASGLINYALIDRCNGDQIRIPLSDVVTVADLKQAVKEVHGIPAVLQMLFSLGQKGDSDELRDCVPVNQLSARFFVVLKQLPTVAELRCALSSKERSEKRMEALCLFLAIAQMDDLTFKEYKPLFQIVLRMGTCVGVSSGDTHPEGVSISSQTEDVAWMNIMLTLAKQPSKANGLPLVLLMGTLLKTMLSPHAYPGVRCLAIQVSCLVAPACSFESVRRCASNDHPSVMREARAMLDRLRDEGFLDNSDDGREGSALNMTPTQYWGEDNDEASDQSDGEEQSNESEESDICWEEIEAADENEADFTELTLGQSAMENGVDRIPSAGAGADQRARQWANDSNPAPHANLSTAAYYSEYHGHRPSHLERVYRQLRSVGCREFIYLAGDSSLDNKHWFFDFLSYQTKEEQLSEGYIDRLSFVADARNGYETVLWPPKMVKDVSYWLNYEAAKQYGERKLCTVMTSVEESTVADRENGLLAQDVFIHDHITENDHLIVSVVSRLQVQQLAQICTTADCCLTLSGRKRYSTEASADDDDQHEAAGSITALDDPQRRCAWIWLLYELGK
jgi:hypothetical protein